MSKWQLKDGILRIGNVAVPFSEATVDDTPRLSDYLEAFMPESVRRLPRNQLGYPIPFFIDDKAGNNPDMRYASGDKLIQCHKHGLCWVCGTPLHPTERAFLGGQQACINRCFGDFAMHEDCAVFSLMACPFLNGQRKARAKRPPPAAIDLPASADGLDPARPEYQCLYITKTHRLVKAGQGYVNLVGPPARVKWYRDGAEVPESQIPAVLRLAAAPNLLDTPFTFSRPRRFHT